MQPMGFWESVFFGVMCAIGAVWPVMVLVGLYLLARMACVRLARDARQLVPEKKVAAIPRQVTVAMLAADSETRYVPGQWANDQ